MSGLEDYSEKDFERLVEGINNEDLKLYVTYSLNSIAVNCPGLFKSYFENLDRNVQKLNEMVDKIENEEAIFIVSECLGILNKEIAENPEILEKYIDFINCLKTDDEKIYLSSGFVAVLGETPEELEYFTEKIKMHGAKDLKEHLGRYKNIVPGIKEYAALFLNTRLLFSKIPEVKGHEPRDLVELVRSFKETQ